MIVCNLALFLLIATGQALIYWSVKSNTLSGGSLGSKTSGTARNKQHNSKDMVIARRLLTIALSDFLCWFPIGMCGLLSSRGMPIPSEVNVAMAILVLPLNSALNPFLYTLNIVLERRHKKQIESIKRTLLAQIKQEV